MSGLGEEFSGKVEGHNQDATTEENKKVVKELGFQLHGLVIRSPSGEALFKQADHQVDMDEVRETLGDLLAD